MPPQKLPLGLVISAQPKWCRSAVITGVYKLTKLQEAQRRGLTIFWAYKLKAMLDWIESTRP